MFEVFKIVRYCSDNNLFVWCGGMFEVGIGRVYNIVFVVRVEFIFLGDIFVLNCYFNEDIVLLVFVLN